MRILSAIFVLLLLASYKSVAFAHENPLNTSDAPGIIVGKVIDAKTGRGVPGASVSINSGNSVTTAEDGSYRITKVPVGTHTVAVRILGYAKQTRQITIGNAAALTANFELEPSVSVLNEVVVTGTIVRTELKAVPNAITVITAKQIEERGIARIDQLFRGEVPGLFSINMGSGALLDEVTMFSRGPTALVSGFAGSATTENSTNTIKTYIDGVEMADSKYLSQIDPKSIERIEILTGPQASTIYGSNAINGIMQIFTKRGTTPIPSVNLGWSGGMAENNVGSGATPSHDADITISGVDGRISYNVNASWNYIGSWTPAKQTQRLNINSGSRFDLENLTADFSIRRGVTRNSQKGLVEHGFVTLRTSGFWNIDATSGIPRSSRQTLLGQTLGLSMSFRPLPWWSHEMILGSDASTTESLQLTQFLTTPIDTSLQLDSDHMARTSQRYTTTIQLPLSSLAHLNLTFGGDHFRTKGFALFPLPTTISSFNGPIFCSNVNACRRTRPSKNHGAFVQAQFSVKDMLFFTYGLRADRNPTFGEHARVFPGRYGASFTRDIQTSLGQLSAKFRGSYGTSIRSPSDGQKLGTRSTLASQNARYGPHYTILPNEDMVPEHRQGGEGGIELYFGSHSSIIITRFNETTDNLISQAGSSIINNGPGLDSVRSLAPQPETESSCGSTFRDAEGHCYRYQRKFVNAGSIRNQGWELTGSLNLGPLTTRGTYSWTKSRVLGVTQRYEAILNVPANGNTFQPGRSFDLVPEHTWALGMTYAHATTSLSLSVNGIGMRYTQGNDSFLSGNIAVRLLSDRSRMEYTGYRYLAPAYATADLNATHRFTSYLDAVLHVSNLMDYYETEYDPRYVSVGRQTRLGLRWRIN